MRIEDLFENKSALLVMREVTEKMKNEMNCSVSDINSGNCDEWAMEVERRLPSAEEISPDFGGPYGGHTFIYYRGKYYDAETLEGVRDYKDLPFYKRKGIK